MAIVIAVLLSRPDKSGHARINLGTPGYPGIWGKSPGQRPDFCDFARIFYLLHVSRAIELLGLFVLFGTVKPCASPKFLKTNKTVVFYSKFIQNN